MSPSGSPSPSHDMIVLAGGGGRRMGGVAKARLHVGGRSLLDRVLGGAPKARRVIVVGPSAEMPETTRQVSFTIEDPPGGGPVAGVAAGLHHLTPPAAWVLVVAVDQPAAAAATAPILDLLPTVPPAVDAVCHRDPDGHPQWLLAAYRSTALTHALRAHGSGHGVAMGQLVAGLRFRHVTEGAQHLGDIDTWADHRRWEAHLSGESPLVPPR